MSAEIEFEPLPKMLAETTECGYCGNEVLIANSVFVVAGKYERVDHDGYVVGGLDGPIPESQHWHDYCADSHGLDIQSGTDNSMVDTTSYYINGQTVAAFVLGVILMLIIASVMVV